MHKRSLHRGGQRMNILSLQSHVAYGHVGNSAAVFPLQRIGVEVWPVHTVQFSNHTGYGSWGGRVFSSASIRLVVEGIEARGVLGACDGVLSGYLGSAETGEAVFDAVTRVKSANPAARYCCDTVIGNASRGIFVRRGIPQFFRRRLLPIADIVTPNQFELDFLAGHTSATKADLVAAIDIVHACGPRVVLVTSVHTDDTPHDCVDLVVSDGVDLCRVRTPLLPIVVNGAGDTMAALFLGHHLLTGSVDEAVSLAVSSIFGVLSHTAAAGASEMLLVEAQDEFVRPRRRFAAHRI
jgi:pyridoxine kinase